MLCESGEEKQKVREYGAIVSQDPGPRCEDGGEKTWVEGCFGGIDIGWIASPN